MKLFKHIVDEKTKLVEVIEFEAKNEFDFNNDPVTNFTESENTHSSDKDSAYEWARELNEDIENGSYKLLKCKDCDMYYLLPSSEEDWFIANNMIPPKRCPKCRKKRKKQ